MKFSIWGGAFSALFVSMVVFAAVSPASTALAVGTGNRTWTKTRQIPAEVRHETTPVQQTDALSQKERRSARNDAPVPSPELQQPAPSSPRSDLPPSINREPEPDPNIPAPKGPPATQPVPAEPGLPPPPMPQPAEPGLPPPPMPQPAEPPPLSTHPELNPPDPAEPEQRPPASLPEPEPTLYYDNRK